MHPEFIRLGTFVIYWYGVMVALGVFVSSLIFQRYALRAGFPQRVVSEVFFWIVVFGLVGARLFHVLVHPIYYLQNPLEIVMLRNGGLAIQGGVIVGTLFLLVYSAVRRVSFTKLADLIALVTPVGQAIGRIGCFLNGCCYGCPTDSRLGVRFPPAVGVDVPVHPVQLYDAAACLGIFLFLRWLYVRKPKDGQIAALFMVLFGLARYLLDFLRGDLSSTVFGITTTQVLAVALLAYGGAWFAFTVFRRGEGQPSVPDSPPRT